MIGRRAAVLSVVLALVACAPTSTGSSGPSNPTATGSASGSPPSSGDGAGSDLTIFAAASLRGVLEEIERAYETSVPETTLTVSTDSSAALATQIEQGAPADVFLSADLVNPRRLVDAGVTEGGIVPFAGNRLAVIVPLDDPAGVATPADLAREGVRIVAAGDDVPITRYATELLERLADLPDYPLDLPSRYAANVVSKEDSVAGIVTKIELGEADAGIAYVTDALGSDALRQVEVPAGANVAVTYGAVVLAGSDEPEAARAFLEWLVGPGGQAALAASGFVPPAP